MEDVVAAGDRAIDRLGEQRSPWHELDREARQPRGAAEVADQRADAGAVLDDQAFGEPAADEASGAGDQHGRVGQRVIMRPSRSCCNGDRDVDEQGFERKASGCRRR